MSELIDETELLFYEIVLRQLKRQKKKVLADPSVIFTDAFWADEVSQMDSAITPFLIALSAEVVWNSLSDFASVVSVDPVIANAEFFAQNLSGTLTKNINDTTLKKVRDILAQSVDEQWGLDQLTDALSADRLFGEQRARLIAITETTNVYQGGAEFAMQELRAQGYDAYLVWVTVRDAHVCEICEPRDGKEQGDGWDQVGSAHPGCRCDVIIEIRD